MNYIKTIGLSLALAAVVFMPPLSASAATTYTNASLQAQIQALILQVQLLQQQLALRGISTPSVYPYTSSYCYNNSYCYGGWNDDYDIDEIEVRFVGRIAQVRVEEGRDVTLYAIEARTRQEVAEALSRELRVSVSSILRLIDEVDGHRYHNDDIRSIDVVFEDDDADITVRFRDGDTDRFTLRNVDEDRDEVIEYLADRYDERERDIEDLIDFEYEDDDRDDIRSIDVEFYSDDAYIVIRFRNGDTDHITLRNVDEDEDEVIEYLADRYDMDEDDIEDVIDFEY